MIQKHQKFFVDWWIAASDENEKNDFTKVLESADSLQVDNAAIDEDTNEPPTFTIIMLRNIKIHIYGKTEGLSVDFIEHVKKPIYDDVQNEHLSIPLYLYTKPTIWDQFTIQILLYMGCSTINIDLNLYIPTG